MAGQSSIMSVDSRLPPSAQEKLDKIKRKPGPVPRSIRYAKQRRDHEVRVALALPEIFTCLMKEIKAGGPDGIRAGLWLMESLLGKPAAAEKAPVDDHVLPPTEITTQSIEQITVKQLTDSALSQVKAVIKADLLKQGLISEADSPSIDLTGEQVGSSDHPEGSVPTDR